MITKAYYLAPEVQDDFYAAAEGIMTAFPCFMSSQPVELDWLEVTIQMREEDAAAIERRIAPYI